MTDAISPELGGRGKPIWGVVGWEGDVVGVEVVVWRGWSGLGMEWTRDGVRWMVGDE